MTFFFLWLKKKNAGKLIVFLFPAVICWFQIGLRRKVQTFPGKMVNTLHSDEEKGTQDKESKEESILAMLGIIGTILNLLVIIFVYIYTTLWLLSTCRLIIAHLDAMGTTVEKSSLTGGGLESSLCKRQEASTRHHFRWPRPPEPAWILSSAQVDSSRIPLRLWLKHVHGDGHLKGCSRHAKDCTESFFQMKLSPLQTVYLPHGYLISFSQRFFVSVHICIRFKGTYSSNGCFYTVFLSVFGEIDGMCCNLIKSILGEICAVNINLL